VPAAFAPPTPAQQRHRQRILQIRQEVGKFYSEIATKVATVESLFAQIEGSEGGAEEITRDGLPAEEIKALLATLKSALTVSP
jgi:hypothetical protein